MLTCIALLRGINVGGHNKVPMADLRVALESAGFARVRTYIQSGNVVVDHDSSSTSVVAAAVREVIAGRFSLDIPVIVIDAEDLGAVVDANPFAHEPDPRRVHAFFLPDDLDPASAERLDRLQETARAKGTSDQLTVVGRTLYLHTPDGFGTSDLAKAMSTRTAGVLGAATARNWATVTALLSLARE